MELLSLSIFPFFFMGVAAGSTVFALVRLLASFVLLLPDSPAFKGALLTHFCC